MLECSRGSEKQPPARRKHATRINAARTSACAALAVAVWLITLHRAGGTEEDAKMAASADSWFTVASHLQKNGDTVGASCAARTCVRLGASLPCHDLLARLLAAGVAPPGAPLPVTDDWGALTHFRSAALMQPSAATHLNPGLAFSRVYSNVAAGHTYGAALGFDHGSEAWTSAAFRESEALQGMCAGWDTLVPKP